MNERKYNTTNKKWHDVASENNVWIKWRFEIVKKSMQKVGIDFEKKYNCLDLGCGRNNFALNLENISNFTIDQVDVDSNNLSDKLKGRGSIFEYDINNKNKVYENKYDIVFLLDVLEHIDNEKEFLESCYFHLKKDGYLIINVPSIPVLFSKYDVAVGHIRRYSKKNLKNVLLENKFGVILIRYWGFILVPVLFWRKILIDISKKNNAEIIKKGMDTQPVIVLFVINLLKYIELKLLKIDIFGTSLISIVKK